MSHVEGKPENIAYLTLLYDDHFIAHVHVNWLAPVKLRRTLIGGSRRMIVYDDLDPSEKVKVYDSGIVLSGGTDVYKMLIDYRTGDMWAPKVGRGEALQAEVAEFFECIRTGARPTSDGAAGLRLVRLLEAASRSLAGRGTPVEIGAA
jgi:predicted dehydrogenase